MSQPNEQTVFKVKEVVSIIIEPDLDQDGVIVKWDRAGKERSWALPGAIEAIKRRAESLREGLNAIRDVYTKGSLSKESEKLLAPDLKQIARQGELLYKYLFSPYPKVKEWLKQQEEAGQAVIIVIRVNPQLKFHAPWGLMFSRPLADENAPISDDDLKHHFWSIKHRLTTVLQSDLDEISFPQAAAATDSDSLLCRSTMRAVNAKLKDFYKAGRVSHEWDNQFERKHGNKCLYFFCHSEMAQDEGKLSLQIYDDTGKRSTVDSADFNLYAGMDRECAEIVFFNACDTARFQEDRKWLLHVWRNGLRGFVGTEVEVPAAAAWRFGIDFLEKLFSRQRTVLETMEALRFEKDYWPLVLLYGIYADPEFSLKTV
jgi:hypothetical protein